MEFTDNVVSRYDQRSCHAGVYNSYCSSIIIDLFKKYMSSDLYLLGML